jgi:phosphatidylglycerophosphatase C
MDLALFDFDGTITERDTYTGFIYFATGRARQLLGTAALALPILSHRLGLLPGTHLRVAVSRVAFALQSQRVMVRRGEVYARQVIPTLLRANALERLAWHRARGDRIVIVSASLDVYLRPWCEEHGYGLLCTELDARAGVLTGGYRGGDCTGAEKARRVRASYDLSGFSKVYAYGDTPEDRALLQLAHERYYCWERVN